MSTIFKLGSDHLTTSKCLAIAQGKMQLVLEEVTRQDLIASNQAVHKIANGDAAVYGINTGFGPLCNTRISKEQTAQLQKNLLLSHSVGVGELIATEIAKVMLILKAHALSKAYSGVSITVLDRIIWHIENDLIPTVPSQGSVGASGDLAPLSHLFLPLIGKGEIMINGIPTPTLEVLKKYDKPAIELGPKDGLALINGTQFIAAHCIFLLELFYANLSHADIIGALMIEGLQGSVMPFHNDLHQLRPFKANIHVAARISSFLENSEIVNAHMDCDKVQDPYSLRCMPQVHGASRNAWLHLKENVEIEINSVTDNPIVFNENYTISGGNFHGQPLALPIDYACLANSELGSISDRRMYLSLEGKSKGVPKLLMSETGLNSGFMILQYTAAALASENKSLCFPASADSISTSLGQEDHVSMGSIGARKALKVAENTQKILAIELVCAAQAFEFRRPLKSGKLLEKVFECARSKVAFAKADRLFANDMNASIDLLKSKIILEIEKEIRNANYSEYDNIFEVY